MKKFNSIFDMAREINHRFISGNSIEVERAYLKKDEWECLLGLVHWVEDQIQTGNSPHGVEPNGEDYCRFGQFTREIDFTGNAETYPCSCGLEEVLYKEPKTVWRSPT